MSHPSNALRERPSYSGPALVPGARVFARSNNGKYYVAEVLAAEPGGCRVEFLSGGEHVVSMDELRPCTFLPGDRVTVDWPWWGVYTCTVVSYDAASECVTLTDGWGSEEVFEMDKVWIEPPKDEAKRARTRAYGLVTIGILVGTALGATLTLFFLR
jgi:hypothetical protein